MKYKRNSAQRLAAARAKLFVAAANAQKQWPTGWQTTNAISELDMAAFEYGSLAQRVLVGQE